MTVQASYSQRPSEAVLGQLATAFEPYKATAKAARGLIKAGYGVFRVPGAPGGTGVGAGLNPGSAFHIPSPGVAADVDAIITAITSSTSVQTFSGVALNGVVGGTEMQPARKVTLVLNSDADWLATNATLTGVNHLGQTVVETLAIPAGGNTTLTSTNDYRFVTSLVIPVQDGTAGTATVGVSALGTIDLTTFLGAAMRQPMKTTLATANLYGYPGVSSNAVTADYIDAESVPVLTAGGIWVYSESATAGEEENVYVRVAAGAGGSVLGAFRTDADTASAVLIPGAKFKRASAAAGPAWINLPFYGT